MALRFLISRLSSLGDVACTLPVAGTLKGVHPDCEVVWVVDPRFAGVVECCEAVDRVVVAKPGLQPKSWPSIEGEFDAALDMQGLLKSSIPVARAKSKRKLGYHWQREGAWLFSQPVTPDPTSFHIVDQYVDVARAVIVGCEGGRARDGGRTTYKGEVGGKTDDDLPNDERRATSDASEIGVNENLSSSFEPQSRYFALQPKPDDLVSVRAKLDANGVGSRFVAVNAGAGWITKRWPAAHFAAVVDALAKEGIQTVLLGGKAAADREAANAVASAAQEQPIDLLGQTSVRELIALLSLAEAHLGGDTGSTHLMAALGRPAIGLYSITRPQRSCPYGQIDRCHYDPHALADIPPGPVLSSLMEALN